MFLGVRLSDLVLNGIIYPHFVLFHHDNYNCYWDVYVHGHLFRTIDEGFLIYVFLGFWLLRICLPLGFLFENWIKYVTMGLLYAKSVLSTWMFYRGSTVWGFQDLQMTVFVVFGAID